ncbi:MAG: hypothetical protein C4290_13065, partial [Chloroflexota bacterium]
WTRTACLAERRVPLVAAKYRTRPPLRWTRIQLQIAGLAAEVERLRKAGVQFRNDSVTGAGGYHILLDDPSGKLLSCFSRHNRGIQGPRAAANMCGGIEGICTPGAYLQLAITRLRIYCTPVLL